MSQQIYVRAFTTWFWDKREPGTMPLLQYLGHTDKYELCEDRLKQLYAQWLREEHHSDADIRLFTQWLVEKKGFFKPESPEDGYVVLDGRQKR